MAPTNEMSITLCALTSWSAGAKTLIFTVLRQVSEIGFVSLLGLLNELEINPSISDEVEEALCFR